MTSSSFDFSNAGTRTLSNAEVDMLAGMLESVGSEDSMLVEELDGFLTAIVCGPEPIPPDEYLPEAFGRTLEQLAAAGAHARPALELVVRHRNALGAQFFDGDEPTPVLEDDPQGPMRGHAWALGFLRGVGMRAQAWEALESDPESDELLDPVLTLAAAIQDDEDARDDAAVPDDEGPRGDTVARGGAGAHDDAGAQDDGDAPPIPAAEREPLIEAMMESAVAIYAYFRDQRERALAPATVRREARKVGRNDPCPCGSGRKYKQCCGR